MDNTVIPVILSGGSGTRLWPKSRQQYPKQFLKMNDESSMFQQTVKRLRSFDTPIVICNDEQQLLVEDQLREINTKVMTLLEPFARDTAPAIAVAALHALKEAEDPVLIILPSDHQISDNVAFQSAMEHAFVLAEEGKMVAFGIKPTSPQEGFGYIKISSALVDSGVRVDQFIEKPSVENAKTYVKDGDYLWNSGIFIFKASIYLAELGQKNLEMLACCEQSYDQAVNEDGVVRLASEPFKKCPSDSIDYAVMETTDKSWVVPLLSPWNDLGSWSSLWEVSEKDDASNVAWGDVLSENCHGNLFYGEGRLIAAIGLEDLVIVDTKDALLVAKKDQVQGVKKLVSQLAQAGRVEHVSPMQVVRPWGSYDAIDQGQRYQVKHITVNPGESLSLQMHYHRAEHWIVVTGTALVQRGEKEVLLSENESIYIPIGEKHRLTNPGKLPLQLIEVQSGCYLGEDDIVRFSDVYHRAVS